MRVEDLDYPRRRILERLRQKSIVDEKDIEFFALEQPNQVLCDGVVPPLVDGVMVAAGILVQLTAVGNDREIFEALDQLTIIAGHLFSPVAIDRIEQERNRKPHPPEQRHRLVHPIAIAVITRKRRRRRQDKDGAVPPRHYCRPSARKLRQSAQSVASSLPAH
jgi:hypothetical protein